MYTKVSRHIISRILGDFRKGHERTWFSHIIYSEPPEPWPQGHRLTFDLLTNMICLGITRPLSNIWSSAEA